MAVERRQRDVALKRRQRDVAVKRRQRDVAAERRLGQKLNEMLCCSGFVLMSTI